MKAFIEANFKMIDIDSDGIIGAKEFRYNCITRVAVDSIQVVDDAFNKLLDVNEMLLNLGPNFLSEISFLANFIVLFQISGRRSTTRWPDIGKIPRIVWSLLRQYRRSTSWCLPIRSIELINAI